MPDIVEWTLTRPWWEYALTAYVVGYAASLPTIYQWLEESLVDEAGKDPLLRAGMSTAPHLLAMWLIVVTGALALLWPISWPALAYDRRDRS